MASQGLYNSGYSDSAQIAQTTAYRERANATALERVRALRELETQISVARMEGSANLSELEAQYQQLMQEQWNVDRAYNYQVGRDAIGDARYDKEWEHQLEREAVGDAQWEKEFAAAQAAVEFEKELALKEAKSAEEQQAIENAFKLGMAGDVSRLKELGMDTSYLERLLALEEQQLYQSVYGGGGSGGGYSGGGGKGNSETAPSYQYTYDDLYKQFSDMLYYEVVSATSTDDLNGNKTTTTKKDQERRSEAEINVVNTLLSLEVSGQVSSGDVQALLDSFGLRTLYNETLNAKYAQAEKEEKEEEAKARKQASRKKRIDELYEELHHADAAKTEEVEKYALSFAREQVSISGEEARQMAAGFKPYFESEYGAKYFDLYMKLIEYHHPDM